MVGIQILKTYRFSSQRCKMTPEEPLTELSTGDRIRSILGLLLLDAGTILFIKPACKILMIKPVNPWQLYTVLMRHDSERRHSRYGLELLLSFNRTYLSEDEFPYPNCANCDYSADFNNETCHAKSKIKKQIPSNNRKSRIKNTSNEGCTV